MAADPSPILEPPDEQAHRVRQGLLIAFFEATTRARADDLRLRECLACKAVSPADREAQCHALRCGLCNPTNFFNERVYLFDVVVQIFSALEGARPMLERELNSHIARCGCATVGFDRGSDGRYRLMYNHYTLRALIHSFIVQVLAYRAGDRVVLHMKGRKLGALIAEVRQHFKWWHQVDVPDRAAWLREFYTDTEVAEIVGQSPKTVRNKLGPRSGRNRKKLPPLRDGE